MALTQINTNIGALNALAALNNINNRLSVHQLRLATGKRINSAADDAAGFTIANRFTARIAGLGSALSNIGDAKNLATVAEGHLNNINDILAQMKSKASQAASDTLGSDERSAILQELQELNSQLNLEATQAQWSGTNVLNGDINFQIGASTTSADKLTFNVAESVWSSGTSTTFNSTGLDVVVSSSSAATFSGSLATLSTDYSTNTLATTGAAASNATVGQLASGHYTLEISSTGAGSATGASLTITLRDSNGDAVLIDANGVAGGTAGASLSTTLAVGTAAVSDLDLGGGIKISLAGIATANGTGEAALWSFDYTKGGNTVEDMDKAQAFMQKVDDAMDDVAKALSYIGSVTNRLSYQEESMTVAKTNTEAARSRIVDADMAWEQLQATKLQILQQTAVAMLAQSNTAPQAVLGLFR